MWAGFSEKYFRYASFSLHMGHLGGKFVLFEHHFRSAEEA
jgi:hypothetical protein